MTTQHPINRAQYCYDACLRAHPKPTDPDELNQEIINLVNYIIDEKCAPESERDALLTKSFEDLRDIHCHCQCRGLIEDENDQPKPIYKPTFKP